jgi:hypothetical protein
MDGGAHDEKLSERSDHQRGVYRGERVIESVEYVESTPPHDPLVAGFRR